MQSGINRSGTGATQRITVLRWVCQSACDARPFGQIRVWSVIQTQSRRALLIEHYAAQSSSEHILLADSF